MVKMKIYESGKQYNSSQAYEEAIKIKMSEIETAEEKEIVIQLMHNELLAVIEKAANYIKI